MEEQWKARCKASFSEKSDGCGSGSDSGDGSRGHGGGRSDTLSDSCKRREEGDGLMDHPKNVASIAANRAILPRNADPRRRWASFV
jgi:hypothetical protein